MFGLQNKKEMFHVYICDDCIKNYIPKKIVILEEDLKQHFWGDKCPIQIQENLTNRSNL
jgi:hypothetical protein